MTLFQRLPYSRDNVVKGVLRLLPGGN